MGGPVSPRFHVIIVSDGASPWLEPCLGAALAQTLPPMRVTLYDRSGDAAAAAGVGELFPEVALLRSPAPLSHAAAHNRAAATVRDADFMLLLEPEAVMAQTCLEGLALAFKYNLAVGVLGGKVLSEDVETIQELGAFLTGNGLPRPIRRGELDEGQYEGLRHALCAPVGALAVRAGVWCELGGLDEKLNSPHYEKTDFCLRAQQHNWRVGVACDAAITFFGELVGAGSTPERLADYYSGRLRFLLKHYQRRDWMRRFWPAELRWLASRASRGQRAVALRTTMRGLMNGHERRSQAAPPPPPDRFEL